MLPCDLPPPLRRIVAAALLAAAVGAALVARPAAATPTELFFSEYLEGSSNNKALEIYNGTGSSVPLAGAYDVQIFANGSTTATATVPLTGTIAPGDAFVLARGTADAAILAVADQVTANFLFNGNDAVVLRHAGTVVDTIGQVGVDPGVEWGTGDASTADNTLRRRPTVQAGDADGTDPFDPAIAWIGFPLDQIDGLGRHSLAGTGPNVDPVATADVADVLEDTSVTIDVVANDGDADGDPLNVDSVSDPAHGIADITGGGTVRYAPDVDFHGTDTFTYSATDGRGGLASATVTVTVTEVNDDPDLDDDVATTPEDTPATVDVLANDTDVDGDSLVVSAIDGVEHGTALPAPDGRSVVYAPDADFNGTESLEVTVSDGHGGMDSAEVVVTVTPVDDPPRPGNDLVAVPAGTSVIVDALANDTPGPADEHAQVLTLVAVGTPLHGTAEIVASGNDAGRIRYAPAPGFHGADSFTYTVSDGQSSATGTVTLAVAQATVSSLCSLAPTIVGTLGPDTLTGTSGDDVIRGRRGNDVIDGNGGNDIICGGSGDDRITTHAGDDAVAAGSGNDTVDSGDGADRVRGGFGRDTLKSGPGDDRVAAGPGNDTVDAGAGNNRVSGGDGDDALAAGSGNDRIDGGPGTDHCEPGTGRNSVVRCEP